MDSQVHRTTWSSGQLAQVREQSHNDLDPDKRHLEYYTMCQHMSELNTLNVRRIDEMKTRLTR